MDKFEEVPESLLRSPSMKIRNLRKVFDSKVAVDNTSMTMYEGQIFALLGHNGAGKTTTIEMLTGGLQASGGSAQVLGLDMFAEMGEVREVLGVCPQHNILFDYLTVREHLELYADFKGKRGGVDRMIFEIELGEVAD